MGLSMDAKWTLTGKEASRYRAARGRKARGQILDKVQDSTEYNRHYAAWLLRNFGRTRWVRAADGTAVKLVVGQRNRRRATLRPRTYDQAVKRVLLFLWDCFDQMCGKRLAALLPQLLPLLLKYGRLKKKDPTYQKLLQISPATIDRLLKVERARRRLKGIAHTKPSTALKNTIPVVISSELRSEQPGDYQIDLVGHDGGDPNGHFAFTLTAVELYSGWVEPRGLLNRAHRWTKEALQDIYRRSPVPLRSLHSDNDSSFLNEPLQSWCAHQLIPYRRARPYHSNDTCYVEQKNYNIVRQTVGYARYETAEEVALLGRLYGKLRLLINFFYPSMKLLEKKRLHGRIRKRYDKPKTPAARLLDSPAVTASTKRQLRQQMRALDPLALKKQISSLQARLLKLVRAKNMKILYPGPSYPGALQRMQARLFPERESS
jgi:transposase InsO family protein